MAAITAALVKELRDKTGAGMMDCKAALNETDGDIEGAVDWLRKKGIAQAAKKSSRQASEGLIGLAASGTSGAMVELNSETDFVSRNESFQELLRAITGVAAEANGDVEVLKGLIVPSTGKTVADSITDGIAVIGENLSLRRTIALRVDQGVVASYVHGALAPGLGRIGVLVGLESSGDTDKLQEAGKQIAMHIAATQPQSVTIESMPADVVARERAIHAEQAAASGKPANIIEKMVDGRMRKFYEDSVLLEQAFVVDTEKKVKHAVEELAKELGTPVSVTGFVRFAVGEGIEKVQTDLAGEVAALAGH
ncbi:translation elongation factor Ts [Marinivivus vitaminiproducens]|uniref:translation elongation factor Ts n=1 Tax=Marinivivus vitaminiproducens TaxID=3035935 RepID=UPI002798E278|nr:translation elongation factor Ts [Geminicoccaceae bacterium SCSIO 64248]